MLARLLAQFGPLPLYGVHRIERIITVLHVARIWLAYHFIIAIAPAFFLKH